MQDNYYKRKVYPFVLTLVDNFVDLRGFEERMEFSDLTESECADFAALLAGDPNADMWCLVEEPHLLLTIRKALKTPSVEQDLELAEEIKKIVISSFYTQMGHIISEVHEEYVTNYCESNNIKKHIDDQTGEHYYQ